MATIIFRLSYTHVVDKFVVLLCQLTFKKRTAWSVATSRKTPLPLVALPVHGIVVSAALEASCLNSAMTAQKKGVSPDRFSTLENPTCSVI